MNPLPEPTPWYEFETGFEPRERWLKCPRYKRCLDLAAYQDWPGFTCWFCPYQKERRTDYVHG